MRVTGVSRKAAGLLMLTMLAVGVLVGAMTFGGSTTPDNDSTSNSRWTTGSAAEEASLLGPALVQDVYLGLSCPTPNSVECDRVTIAVTVDRPAREMRVWIAGRPVEMDPPAENGRSYWEGSLQPAGLVDGPLKQQVQEGDVRYIGSPAVGAEVRIEIETPGRDSAEGSTDPSFAATYRNVYLHAGYG